MKKQLALVLAGITLLGVGTIAVSANALQSENPWTVIGDGYYSPVLTDGSAPVLIRRIVDSDYLAFQTMLMTSDAPKDIDAAEAAAADPDIILPDNMLSDGTLLNAEIYQHQKEFMDSLSSTMVWTGSTESGYSDEDGSRQTINVRFTDGTDASVLVEQVTTNSGTVFVPSSADNLAADVLITPDGSKAIAYTERGMWLTSMNARGSSAMLPETYDGKTYDELAEESCEAWGVNYALWCGQATSSPDSNTIAYVSNKNSLDGLSVFTYNFSTGEERLLANDSGFYYLVIDWVDDNNLLCYKIKDDKKETVLINTSGTESTLNFDVANPSVISCKDGLVAYTHASEADAIYVGKFNGTSLDTIFSNQFDGTLRIRPGINAFSPDGSQLAIIYVPTDSPNDRMAKVFDLVEQVEQEISAVKTRSATNTCILEISWIDNSTLLTVVEDEHEDFSNYTTWSYALNGGETHA